MPTLDLDPSSTAIVVIDLQKGIVHRDAVPHRPAEVIDRCRRIVDAGRSAGATIVLVHVGASHDGADRLAPTADQPVPSGPLPPDWAEFVPELGPEPGDLVVLKRQWGAFYGTDLDLQLRRRGLRTLILCGIATEFGVESTARCAYERGYQQVFAEDAMTGLARESHQNSLRRIFPRLGRVRETAAVIAALRG